MTEPVSVSRTINAPAGTIFAILADPARHAELDGSEMVRGAVTTGVIGKEGESFGIRMHNDRIGDYEVLNHVVEFEPDRRIAWEPELVRAERVRNPSPPGTRSGSRWGYELRPHADGGTVVTETYECSNAPERVRKALNDGENWRPAMTESLERLERMCAQGA
jgi:uncharacterized protein YndB with AHSA1/START domain